MRVVQTSDTDLVDQARGGLPEAFDALYVRHRDAVGRTVYLVVGDVEVARDLAQEAFGIAWRDIGKLRDAGRFRSWTTGIALNLARRRWRRREVPAQVVAAAPTPPDPDDRVAVRGAVQRLPIAQRTVIVLRFYADLDEAEIAEALGVPLGTVKSRMARGRARLALDLEVEHG
jgi:RNA polymerase sigma-70 factor (ECF subfamily)